MRFLDRTLSSPEENLACDEALLDMCEEGYTEDILRVWESQTRFVVLGIANSASREVHREACTATGVPILRRCSGGGTVLQGPGCLNYALVLHINRHPSLQDITGTNRYILQRHATALRSRTSLDIELQGHTDLATEGRKFSGNAQRRRRQVILFHGTFLYRYAVDVIETYLPLPSVEPEYRQGRSHCAFLTNVPLRSETLKDLLCQTWDARDTFEDLPFARISTLVEEKYSRPEWTFRQ
jgi:lipoate-protein ligase A